MSDAIYTEQRHGYTIEIIPDEDADNPREEFSPLGHIAMFKAGRFDVLQSDKNAVTLEDPNHYRRGARASKQPGYFQYRCLRFFDDVAVALAVYTTRDGITCDDRPLTRHDNDEPDGFIYLTRAELLDEYGDGPEAIAKATEYMKGEIEELNSWLCGDVYGYTVSGPADIDDGDPTLDSCWGFYGYDYCLDEARSIVDALVKPLEVTTAA